MKRVVITGSGAISAIGKNILEHHDSIINGICGIKTLDLLDKNLLAIKIGAMVESYCEDELFSSKELSFYDRHTQFAIIAANEAMDQSGFEITSHNSESVGIILGNSGGGLQTLDENYRNVFQFKKKKLHLKM